MMANPKWKNILRIITAIISLTGFSDRPAILQEPDDITYTPGTDNIVIKCIKSQGALVQWYRSGRPINVQKDPDLQVLRDGSLFVRNPRKDRDEGTYYCLVWEKTLNMSLISRTATVRFPCK